MYFTPEVRGHPSSKQDHLCLVTQKKKLLQKSWFSKNTQMKAIVISLSGPSKACRALDAVLGFGSLGPPGLVVDVLLE